MESNTVKCIRTRSFFSSSPAGHLPCVLFQDVSGKNLNLTAANSNERTEEALPWPERLK